MNGLVSSPPWEFERHRRGPFRWYPFDALLAAGAASAGSARSIASPPVLIQSLSIGTVGNRVIESAEKGGGAAGTNIWNGADGLNYWQRVHHLTIFITPSSGTIDPIGSRLYIACFLQQFGTNGAPPMPANPPKPQCLLRYARNGTLDPTTPDERFELITATGGGAPVLITRLTGVQGPFSDITPGGARAQRWEIFYKPGEYVQASIDGVVGATVTTNLPNPVTVPIASQPMAGCGCYLEGGDANSQVQAEFWSLMIESYRP